MNANVVLSLVLIWLTLKTSHLTRASTHILYTQTDVELKL